MEALQDEYQRVGHARKVCIPGLPVPGVGFFKPYAVETAPIGQWQGLCEQNVRPQGVNLQKLRSQVSLQI